MKMLMSALTRYHVFDLALQLQGRGMVHGLVTAYPKFKLGGYSALEASVVSLRRFAFARKGSLVLDRYFGSKATGAIHEMMYARFSAAVANIARRRDARVVYGLSGYMQELLESDIGRNKVTVVDHGSLHIETEKDIMRDECARFGFSEFGNWQYDWLVRRMSREFALADHVVCCSELARESMLQNGVPHEKLVVHRLGVDLSRFSRNPGRQPADGRAPRLLFVGAMTPLKGLHYLLESFTQLSGNAELWLVGALPTDKVLKALIAECGRKTGRLRVIGPVPQAELNRIYNQCDVFVLPSLSDGWGMVVSQAVACGLPVVVSDMTGAKELVKQTINGFVVKSRDAADLREKLEWSIENCRSGVWSDGVRGTDALIAKQSWNDYGDRWAQWLQRIDV